MNIGVSTACLYPMQTEEALARLLALRFQTLEIFFNSYSEIQPGFARALRRQAEAAGARVVSIHPFTSGFETMLLFSDYERRFWDALELYREYFAAANELGAGILVLHGERDYRRQRITEEIYLERYAKLRALGASFGVEVAQENVNLFRAEDPAFLRRMRQALGKNCSFVFDVKQAVRAGFDPFDVCAAMGDRIAHVHLNDNCGRERDCLLPGRGKMDYRRLARQLQAQGYGGDAVVEVYRRDFGEAEDLAKARAFLAGVWDGAAP